MAGQAAVVLAAGKGSRMKSQIPKVLHQICGRELVACVVEAIREAGFDRIVVVVGQNSKGIKKTLGHNVDYVAQKDPLGTGHALLQSRNLLTGVDNIVVLNGDVPLIRPTTIRSMMQHHLENDASITLMTSTPESIGNLGKIARDRYGRVNAIVEASETGYCALATNEVNAGVYCFNSTWLWPSLNELKPRVRGEMFLTDLISSAHQKRRVVESIEPEHPEEALGVNTKVQLANVENILRHQIREDLMMDGVIIHDPASTYIDATVRIGQDTVLLPNTHIIGKAEVGLRCEIGPNTVIEDSTIGDGCRVIGSVIHGSTLEDDVEVGPFSNLRAGTYLEKRVYIGSHSELKNSRLGNATKAGHFSYIGDARIGANVNIGAGTVTCNYDGIHKNVTLIEDDVLIGSDTMLVAPITIGARSRTGAGAVVTKDVPPDTLVIGVPARENSRKSKPKIATRNIKRDIQ